MPHAASSVHCALVVALLLPPGAPENRSASAQVVPHLRAATTAERQIIDRAVRYSPTVRRLIEAIERSDVYVYVQLIASPQVPTASTTFTTSTPQGRYLRVLINAGTPVWLHPQVLAHELQHVVEISADRDVRSDDGIRSLYARIGHASGGQDRFETLEAQKIEQLVRTEMVRSHRPRGLTAER